MSTQNTQFPRKADPLQGALDAVNRPERRFSVIGQPLQDPEAARLTLKSLITPLPVEVSLETPPGDDLASLPGVNS